MTDEHKSMDIEEKKIDDIEEPVDDGSKKISNLMYISQLKFKYIYTKNDIDKNKVKDEIMKLINENNMLGYYKYISKECNWKLDDKLIDTMNKNIEKELIEFDKKIVDAKENFGDSEVKDAKINKVDFYYKIGDLENGLKYYDELINAKGASGSGSQIDLVFSCIRMGFCYDDIDIVEKYIEKCTTLVENGGDWERRNKLKVYNGLYYFIKRQFKEATDAFLSSVATFTCTELFSFETLIFYTVCLSVYILERNDLKKQVVKKPEVLTVIRDIPNLRPFVMSLYKCKYSEFFKAVTDITEQLRSDLYFHKHVGFYLREIRIVAYKQFLQAYKSVPVKNMANSFGVSVKFIDGELSRFIAAGRLTCKVDKVGGIIETTIVDSQNAQYQETIKLGDALVNRIQKLAKLLSY